tara:strand:- start:280 stop:492 length:213 start_codon:yes stop_codon:yes gene_type:complete
MSIQNQMTIIGLIIGFAIGVCSMMFVNIEKEVICYEIIEEIECQVCEECWYNVFDNGEKYQEVQDYVDWE